MTVAHDLRSAAASLRHRPGFSLAVVVIFALGLGLAADLGLLRVIAHQLYRVTLFDPLAVGASMLIVLGVALLAAWLPARQAARVDPMVTLRAE